MVMIKIIVPNGQNRRKSNVGVYNIELSFECQIYKNALFPFFGDFAHWVRLNKLNRE